MSALAKALPSPDQVTTARVRKGPSGECDVYGDGDLEDWHAVDELRKPPRSWAAAQQEVDLAGNFTPIDDNKFRYHWRGKCWHWTADQKAEIRKIEADRSKRASA